MKSKLFLLMFLFVLCAMPIVSNAEENSTTPEATDAYTLELPSKFKTVEVKKNVNLTIVKKYSDGRTEQIENNNNVLWKSSNSLISIKGNQLVPKKIGKVTLTVTYEGKTNSFDIKIVDTKKPVLSGVSNKTVYLKSKFNARTGVRATDNYDGNITKKITVKGKVNTKKTGKYTLTYSVKDSSGNKTVKKRIITVKKNNSLESKFRKYYEADVILYLHKNLVDSKWRDNYENMIGLVPATDKHLKVMTLVGSSGNLKIEKVVIASNNKKKTFKLEKNGLILEDSQYEFFKKNISIKREVKVTFTTSQKTFVKKLSKKEVQALVDAIKLYEKW